MLVTGMQVTGVIIRTFTLTLMQILNREMIIKLINEICDMKKSFNGLKFERFLDKKQQHLLQLKLLSVLFQIIVIIGDCFSLTGTSLKLYGNVMQYVNVYSLSILLNTNYFCVMIFILQFYIELNKKIRKAMDDIGQVACGTKNKMKMQEFCEISDTVDQISIVYDRVTNVCNKVNRLFGPQLLFIITSSFVFLLSGVGS